MDELPKIPNARVVGFYTYNGDVRYWNGKTLRCEHKRRRTRCVDCDGTGICEHKRQRAQCVDCDGTGICEHKRQRASCKDCGGTGICQHGRQRTSCKDCNPQARIFYAAQNRIRKSLPTKTPIELLGCTKTQLIAHLQSHENWSKYGCTLRNHGTLWTMDHVRPIAAFDLSDATQQHECFIFTNIQPLPANKNYQK